MIRLLLRRGGLSVFKGLMSFLGIDCGPVRLPQACVATLSGRRARRKLIRVTGRTAKEVVAQISALATPEVKNTRRDN